MAEAWGVAAHTAGSGAPGAVGFILRGLLFHIEAPFGTTFRV